MPKENEIERFLQIASQYLSIKDPIFFETSIKFSQDIQQLNGRIIIWLNTNKDRGFSPIEQFLEAIDAPNEVKNAQQRQHSFVQGISLESKNDSITYRLYLHIKNNEIQKDGIEGWRWGKHTNTQFHQYRFYFFPETPNGEKPLDFIPDNLKACVTKILATPKFQQISGFWLRRDKAGKVSQIDLAFPWNPAIEDISGIIEALQILKIDEVTIDKLKKRPIRHIAFSVNQPIQSLTFYTSAKLEQFPKNELDLNQALLKNAQMDGEVIQKNIFDKLPLLPKMPLNNEIGDFYDGPVNIWHKILGKGMHYHAGIFETSPPYTETDINLAFKKAVTSLYQFIPYGCRLYDMGCEWGGTLDLLTKELNCSVIGITPSKTQYQYVSKLGLSVRLGNPEYTYPPGKFDVILLLESFAHIKDKLRLLKTLKHFTNRIIIRLNCQDVVAPSKNFGSSMHMISSSDLRELLRQSAWTIRHWRNRRQEGLPSIQVWHNRLKEIPPTKYKNIETLRKWSSQVVQNIENWGAQNSLIEVVADNESTNFFSN